VGVPARGILGRIARNHGNGATLQAERQACDALGRVAETLHDKSIAAYSCVLGSLGTLNIIVIGTSDDPEPNPNRNDRNDERRTLI
jgi:hypothetical protein